MTQNVMIRQGVRFSRLRERGLASLCGTKFSKSVYVEGRVELHALGNYCTNKIIF